MLHVGDLVRFAWCQINLLFIFSSGRASISKKKIQVSSSIQKEI